MAEESAPIPSQTRNGLRIDPPVEHSTNSSISNDNHQFTPDINSQDTDEYTQWEMEHLVDALGMDKTEYTSDDRPNCRENSSSYPDAVIDPVDLELMSAAKYVVFKHIGTGLDDTHASTKKKKSPLEINANQYTITPMKRKKHGAFPGTRFKPRTIDSPYVITSSIPSILEKTKTGKVTKTHLDSKSSYCIKSSKKREVRKEMFTPVRNQKNKSSERDTKYNIYDANPPFPVDDITISNDMNNVILSLNSSDCEEKETIPSSGEDSGIDMDDPDFKIDLPMLSMKSQEIESMTTICEDYLKYTTTKSIKEFENPQDDVDSDNESFLRSLMNEEEEHHLIPPFSWMHLQHSVY
mmetsp:Transcript_9587/g.20118  ORF Transcript_9587/g.20118 Transcript_9587/m.20118 type:complete len:352 (-) Transcript_9587:143-1198(-)